MAAREDALDRGFESACARLRVLVCVGAGGVGKTTTSAALGLAAARRGRRVLVCTIDPAKRLADALGIGRFRNEEIEVARALLESSGAALPSGGSLHAMMLDTKGTFDRLVTRYAKDEETARRILANPIYQQLSSQLAGSQEYMAMEKLHDLYQQARFDLIVLDTPPTRHALDFLEAPERLSRFFDVSVVRWFVAPFRQGGAPRGVAARVSAKVMHWLGRLFGAELLRELGEFFAALETLWGGFRERAERVKALLADPTVCGFIVVSSAAQHSVAEARYFEGELRAHEMPLLGFVANRVHGLPGANGGGREGDARLQRVAPVTADAFVDAAVPSPQRVLERLGRMLERAVQPENEALVRQAIEILGELESLARADREALSPLRELATERGLVYREVPAFETDVHTIGGLVRLDRYLMPERALDLAEVP